MTVTLEAIQALIADNSMPAAAGGGIIVFLYKIWRILKVDRKVDNLDDVEKQIRDELRLEVKALKDEIKLLREQIHQLQENQVRIQNENTRIEAQNKWLKTCLSYCKEHRPDTCALLQRLGPKHFESLVGPSQSPLG